MLLSKGNKHIISSLLVAFCILSFTNNEPFDTLTNERIKKDIWQYKDFKTCSLKYNSDEMGKISKLTLGNYCIVQYENEMASEDCETSSNYLAVYLRKDNDVILESITPKEAKIIPLINKAYFTLTYSISSMSQVNYNYRIEYFNKGRFEVIADEQGFDKSVFYQNINGSNYSNSPNPEYKALFKRTINDTIIKEVTFEKFKFSNTKLISCEKKIWLGVLKGSYSEDSIIIKGYSKRQVINFP